MTHAFLGPKFDDNEIVSYLDSVGVEYRQMERQELVHTVAQLLAEQNVIGWFQGRMEYGPRALGSRSIIADARNPENWKRVNLKIKFRESFRPFAPTILEEKVKEYFEFDRQSPYMLFVAQVRNDKRTVPAITHVDGSARLQTINRDQHELYYDLIKEFDRQTGCPLIINTSFNVRGEPIVCTPQDAVTCFIRTDMDYLVMGALLLDKKRMKAPRQDEAWQKIYQLD